MSSKTAAAAFALTLLCAIPLRADDPCPCIPVTHLWTVLTCDTWECATAALADSNGNRDVFVVPSSNDVHRWLVLRRIVAGTATQSLDAPFVIEQFSKMVDASVRFDSIDSGQAPALVTTYDHAVLVVYMRDAPVHRRSTGH